MRLISTVWIAVACMVLLPAAATAAKHPFDHPTVPLRCEVGEVWESRCQATTTNEQGQTVCTADGMVEACYPMAMRAKATAMAASAAASPPISSCPGNTIPERQCVSYMTKDGVSVCSPDGWIDACVDPSKEAGQTGVKSCELNRRVCVDTSPSKVINSYEVTLAEVGGCWKWQRDYTCITDNIADTCQPLRDRSECTAYTRQCITDLPGIGCVEYEMEYRCLVKRGQQREYEYCGDNTICIGGICFESGWEPDGDFAQVVADMEIARQIGVYNPDGLDIFGGVGESCRSARGFGLKNCCTKKGGAKSNNAFATELFSAAGGAALRSGSKYVFDMLYGSSDVVGWLSSGMGSMVTNTSQAASEGIANWLGSGPSFGMYGVSIGGTGAFLGTQGYLLAGGAGTGFPALYFNPYALAFAIAMQFVMEVMSCDQKEMELALKRDAGLCTDRIGSWCSKKVLGACATRKQSYCCYNSKLARIINEQGRAQLGKGWGDEKDPTCDGFTPAELEKIDFSQIDLSEFLVDVMAAVETQYAQFDLNKAKSGTWTEDAVAAGCRKALEAVGGDWTRMPDGDCKKALGVAP